MDVARARELLQKVRETIRDADKLLGASSRDCSGGVVLWHRYSPETMGEIGGRMIDARYDVEEALRALKD